MFAYEEWKQIEEFQNYEVSSYGRVRNRSGLLLKQHRSKAGYRVVHLYKQGKRKTLTVHRLVAIAFVPNPDPEHLTVVNHKTECKTRNHKNELEWTTPKDNNNYGTVNRRRSKSLKEHWNNVRRIVY